MAETIILLRKRVLTGVHLLWGWVGTVCMLVLGVAVTAGVLALLIVFGKVPPIDGESWIAHPLPMSIAASAIAFLAAAAAGALLARRAGFWGFWAAASMLSAVLSVASAALVPGTSFVFCLTAFAAALAALPCIFGFLSARTPSTWAVDAAALVPALVIFAATLPLLPFAYTALGSVAWPLSTLLLCLGTAALLPLLAAASRQGRQRVIALAALIALGGTLMTLVLPTYSADWPQRINFEYWLDADTGQAHWLAQPDSLRLPAQIARAADFDPLPRPRYAGSASLRFYATAPRLELAAPELTLTSQPLLTSSVASTTHYDLRLRSARGAPEVVIIFPAGAKIDEVTVMTQAGPSRAKLHRLRSGATRLEVVGLSPADVEFSINAAGQAPLTVQVFDQSYEFDEGKFLQRARPIEATSSQDGDLTVVHRTVTLDPAAGR